MPSADYDARAQREHFTAGETCAGDHCVEHSAENDAEVDLINAAFPDRSAGRWCGRCMQNGTHHTDRHVEFLRAATRVLPPEGGNDA